MWLVSSKRVQQGVLVLVLLLIFYDGIWGGAPRADHIIYLHNMWGDDTLAEIVSGAWDWNRERSNGDFILFRPLLYLQLGLFYHFFGYEFALWQLAGLLLHVAIVLLLHSCLWRTRLDGSLWPLVLTLPLAVSQFGGELVLWNHLGGYLLFALTALACLRFLISYARTGRRGNAAGSLLSAFASTFLYETGTLLCFLVAIWLFARAWTRGAADRNGERRRDVLLAGGLLPAGMICPIWGLTDLALRYGELPYEPAQGGGGSTLTLLAQGSWYALYQIGYWLAGFLVPGQFDLTVDNRTIVGRVLAWWPIGPLQGAAYLAALLVIVGGALQVGGRIFRQSREFYFSVALCSLFLYGYSWVIAFGRSVPRGVEYVLYYNIYYGYIAYTAIGAVICVCLLFWRDDPWMAKRRPRGFSWPGSKRVRPFGAASFAVGLLAISAVNAKTVADVSAAFRYRYSPDLLETVEVLRAWHAKKVGKSNAYFVLGPNCRGNETLEWFDSFMVRPGKGWAPPGGFGDVLFPEHSLHLNKNRPSVAALTPETIDCVADRLAVEDLLGDWRGRRRARYSFALGNDGQLIAVDRSGAKATASLRDGLVEIPAWSLSGRLSWTGTSLLWQDGTAWRR